MKANALADMAMPFDRADVRGRAHARTEVGDDRLRFRQALARESPARVAHWSIDDRVTVLRADQDDDIVASVKAALSWDDGASAADSLPRLTAALERLLARPEAAAMRKLDQPAPIPANRDAPRVGHGKLAQQANSVDLPTRHQAVQTNEGEAAAPKSETLPLLAEIEDVAFQTPGTNPEPGQMLARPLESGRQVAAKMAAFARVDLAIAAENDAEMAAELDEQSGEPLEPMVEKVRTPAVDLPKQQIEPATPRQTPPTGSAAEALKPTTVWSAGPVDPATSGPDEDSSAFEPFVARSPDPAPTKAPPVDMTDPVPISALVEDEVEAMPTTALGEARPALKPVPVTVEPGEEIAPDADPLRPTLAAEAPPPKAFGETSPARQTVLEPTPAPLTVDPDPKIAPLPNVSIMAIEAAPQRPTSSAEIEPAPAEIDTTPTVEEPDSTDAAREADADPDPELSDAIILPFAALAYAPVATVSRKSEARDMPTSASHRSVPIDMPANVAKDEQRSVHPEPRVLKSERIETRSDRDDALRAVRREEAGEAEPLRPTASANAQPTVAVIERPAGVLPALSPTSLSLIAGLAAQPAPVPQTLGAAAAGTPAGPATSLKIQLHPVELGVITATMRIEDGQIAIEIEVENPEALSKLASDRDSIERALRSIGLDVGELRIQQAQPSTAQNQTGGQRDGQGAFAQNQNAAGQSAGQNPSGQNGPNGERPGFSDTVQGETHAAQRNGAGGAADRGGVYI